MVSIYASGPCNPRFDSQHSPKNSKEINIDIAVVNQKRWVEESCHLIENVDPAQLATSQYYKKHYFTLIEFRIS